jgi:hypothetical protein
MLLTVGLAPSELGARVRGIGYEEKAQSSKLSPNSRRPYAAIILTRHRLLHAVPSGCFQRKPPAWPGTHHIT